jgi:hypothetical protein
MRTVLKVFEFLFDFLGHTPGMELGVQGVVIAA